MSDNIVAKMVVKTNVYVKDCLIPKQGQGYYEILETIKDPKTFSIKKDWK